MNDNETVEQVCDEMQEVSGTKRFIDSHYCNNCGDPIDGEGSTLELYSCRILAAHTREKCEWEASLTKQRSINKELVEEKDELKLQFYNYAQAVVQVLMEKDEDIKRLELVVDALIANKGVNLCIAKGCSECKHNGTDCNSADVISALKRFKEANNECK